MRNGQIDIEEQKRALANNCVYRPTLHCRRDLVMVTENEPEYWKRVGGKEVPCDQSAEVPDDPSFRTEFFLPDLDIVKLLEPHISNWVEVMLLAQQPARAPPTSPQWKSTGSIADPSQCFVCRTIRRTLPEGGLVRRYALLEEEYKRARDALELLRED